MKVQIEIYSEGKKVFQETGFWKNWQEIMSITQARIEEQSKKNKKISKIQLALKNGDGEFPFRLRR
jgi:hypothetical protein